MKHVVYFLFSFELLLAGNSVMDSKAPQASTPSEVAATESGPLRDALWAGLGVVITMPETNLSKLIGRGHSTYFTDVELRSGADLSSPAYVTDIVFGANSDSTDPVVTMSIRGIKSDSDASKELVFTSFKLKAGATIRTPEVRVYGFEPFEIRLVPILIQDHRALGVTIAKSVEIEAIATDSSLATYKITVRNVSRRAIRSLNWRIVRHRAAPQLGRPYDVEGHPLIQPGGVYRFTQDGDGSGTLEANGFIVDTPSVARIEAVTFDDGDYEGDAKLALADVARSAAQRMFLERVIALLTDSLDKGATDVQGLRSQLDKLVAPPSRAEQASAIARFGKLQELPPLDRLDAYNSTLLLMRNVIRPDIIDATNAPATADEIRSWLLRTRQRCTDWLSRL